MQRASAGQLVPGKAVNSTGEDSYGSFTRLEQQWTIKATGEVFSTAIRDYTPLKNVAIFEQNFPEGIKSLDSSDVNAAATAYPVLGLANASKTLGYLTWAGNMACPGAQRQCTPTDALTPASFKQVPGGLEGGTPFVVFDDSTDQITTVISPGSNFMAATQVFSTGQLEAGVLGSVKALPAGFSIEFVYSAGAGLTDTMIDHGHGLLRRFGKPPMRVPQAGRDSTVDALTYYTDNGARYYYCTEENKTYAETISDIFQHAKEQDIPYRALQIDSWWYYRGPTNGVTNWTARPDIFPDGLEPVHDEIRVPIVAHNRYWDPSTPYAKQNGGDYDFVIDGYAVPTEERFWVDLMRNGTAWGLSTYEQDWLHNEFERIPAMLENATLARQWLLQMGRGAQAAGTSIQYCMSYPRHVLQSVEVEAVTQARASDDYNPQNDQWSLGVSSILYTSVGLAPWKDDTWTSTVKQDCPSKTKSYAHDTETAPVLELMVSALSTGPVGPSDLIGAEDRDNIMRTCTADGLVLKPSVPATSLDSTFNRRVFGGDGPDGEAWSSYSDITGGARFHQILCASLDSPLSVTPSIIKGTSGSGPRPSPTHNATLVAFRFNAGGAPALQIFSETSRISCPKNDKTSPNLWSASPIFPSGHALIGEVDKFVAVSPMRFTDVDFDSDGFSVRVTGTEGESVGVWVAFPDGPAKRIACELPPSGSAILRVPENTCE